VSRIRKWKPAVSNCRAGMCSLLFACILSNDTLCVCCWQRVCNAAFRLGGTTHVASWRNLRIHKAFRLSGVGRKTVNVVSDNSFRGRPRHDVIHWKEQAWLVCMIVTRPATARSLAKSYVLLQPFCPIRISDARRIPGIAHDLLDCYPLYVHSPIDHLVRLDKLAVPSFSLMKGHIQAFSPNDHDYYWDTCAWTMGPKSLKRINRHRQLLRIHEDERGPSILNKAVEPVDVLEGGGEGDGA
jgi:hypothetical protein